MAKSTVDKLRQHEVDVKRAIDPAGDSRISGDAVRVTNSEGQTDKAMTKALAKSRAMSKAQVEALHKKFAAARAKKAQQQLAN